MNVVECCAGVGMAELLFCDLWRVACVHDEGRNGVSESMKAAPRNIERVEDGVKTIKNVRHGSFASESIDSTWERVKCAGTWTFLSGSTSLRSAISTLEYPQFLAVASIDERVLRIFSTVFLDAPASWLTNTCWFS